MNVPEFIAPVFKARYLLPGETPDELVTRVAAFIASVEKENKDVWAARFRNMINDGDFMPSSPILMNAGTDYPMLSACFVLDVPDDMGGIFQVIKEMALIQQHGGGTGFNFSKIRERGAVVKSTNGVASGVLSFLEVFNTATNVIKQGGKRRGANIAILDVDHPEIEEFIDAKQEDGRLSGFNLSVVLSDKFIKACSMDCEWPLISRATGTVVRVVKALDLMTKIEESMLACGEPGIIFKGNLERGNTTPWLGPLTGVNPCGEVGLYDKEACNLGSINLERFTEWDKFSSATYHLENVVSNAVRFLDNAITCSVFPVEGIREQVQFTRKIGLGITGLHSYLLLRGKRYDSDEGVEDAEKIMGQIAKIALRTSEELGKEKGVAAAYQGSALESFRRNTVITCIAPTGTISMILNTSSSGIEPVFSYSYVRKIDGEDVHIRPPILYELLRRAGVEPTPDLLRLIDNAGGRLSQVPALPTELKELAKTAGEIAPEWHVKMMAAVQKHVENNISKTIALPATDHYSAIRLTVHTLNGILSDAYHAGIRGLTVYVDKSRAGQVLVAEEKCPNCGGTIIREEMCKKCTDCGWSTCNV
jgi:ribonucleoside-diphosphate reductase alpha chain